MNDSLLETLPGDATTYMSIDTVTNVDDAVCYPTEFLNSLEIPGLPPHILSLKVYAPVILIRNLDPPKLCNGTRLIIKTLFPNVVEATVLTGAGSGESVFLPRIPLITSTTFMTSEFKRLQFPLRLAFALSINKAQGQTLSVTGINLDSPCFSHGQFYVACSRVGNPQNLYVYAPNGETKNVVYEKALY